MDKDLVIHKEAIFAALQAVRKLKQPKPGEFESLPRTMANHPLPDIRAAVDDNVKQAVRTLNYEYIPTLSSSEEIVFLDTTPIQQTYSNAVDILKPAYDYGLKKVVFVKIG